MRRNLNIKNTLILVVITGLLLSCGSNMQKPATNTSNEPGLDENTGFSAQNSTYYRFPTPDEIFSFIDNEKLKFNPALLNPSGNAGKYLSSGSQALALGTYVSDLAYITLFESYTKSLEYYKIINQLSEKVRISSTYDLEIAKRIEKNLLNLDSLKNISSDSYASIVEYLIVNNRERTLALIAAGAYIECFYIAFELAGAYSQNNTMLPKIVDLKFAFENLYSYLLIYSDNEDVKITAEKFSALDKLFKQLDKKSEGKTTVSQSHDGSIVLGGGATYKMDKVLFQKMKEEISKIRKEILENK